MLRACERFRIPPFASGRRGWDALDAGEQRLILAYDWMRRKEDAAHDLLLLRAGAVS